MVTALDTATHRHELSLVKLGHFYKKFCALTFQDDNKICFINACTFGGVLQL